MSRTRMVFASSVALLMLAGCKDAPTPPPASIKAAAPTDTKPAASATEAERLAEEERFRRGVEEKKRKRHTYILQSKPYQKYIP